MNWNLLLRLTCKLFLRGEGATVVEVPPTEFFRGPLPRSSGSCCLPKQNPGYACRAAPYHSFMEGGTR